MSNPPDPTVELIITLHESDPLVKVLESELPHHADRCSFRREEVVHYSAGGGSHWMTIITTTITAGGIHWLSKRLKEMFGNTVRVDVTKNSCSVAGRTPEQISAATESALVLMREMREMSQAKHKKRDRKKTDQDE